MKKLLSLFAAFVCMIVFLSPANVYAAESGNYDYEDYRTYYWLEQFVSENPSRTAGTDGETAAADWIAENLLNIGFSAPNISRQSFDVYAYGYVKGAEENAKSQNVILDIKNQNSKGTVVIGAHYDNATNLIVGNDVSGGQGAFDNGSGVAAALTLAEKLKDMPLPFDIRFVFFGGEELGLSGSNYYVNSLTQQQKDDIVLMINFDSICAGEYLYVWGEDVYNPQENYFVEKSGGAIRKTPANKRAIMGVTLGGFRPYYTTMQASDSTPFLNAGVPVAFFFSGNLSSSSFGYVENDGKNSVMHSQNDTLEYLKANFGINFVLNMESVVNTVYEGLVDSDAFVSAVQNARDYIAKGFWLNSIYAYLILLVVVVGLSVAAYFYHKKLMKNAILGNADVKDTKIFSKPNDDDIFTFRE